MNTPIRYEALLPALTIGAHGGFGFTYNLLAPVFVALYQAFGRGDLATAQGPQSFANRVIGALT